MQAQVESSRTAARSSGRCTGAKFFSVFGAVWLLLSCASFKSLTPWDISAILLTAIVLFFTANRLKRKISRFKSGSADPQRKRDDRAFGLVNAVTYIAVFLLFFLFLKIGLKDFIFPAFVGLVGIHFFAMPPSYRHRANLVTGGVLIAWALICALLFRPDGDRMAAFASLGAGITLWVSAVWALKVANGGFAQLSRSN